MPRYEYKVVPAPTKGLKGKGVKGAEARFSHAIQELMNGLSGYGWEYQRAETLPSIERSGLTGSNTEWRNVLVFRRLREADTELFSPELLPSPEEGDATPSNQMEKKPTTPAADSLAKAPAAAPVKPAETAAAKPASKPESGFDNGVEDTSEIAGIGGALKTLAAKRKFIKSKD